MTARRTTSESKSDRKAPAQTTQPKAAADRAVASAAATEVDPRRIMREAAWSQMFGRVESKNPFSN